MAQALIHSHLLRLEKKALKTEIDKEELMEVESGEENEDLLSTGDNHDLLAPLHAEDDSDILEEEDYQNRHNDPSDRMEMKEDDDELSQQNEVNVAPVMNSNQDQEVSNGLKPTEESSKNEAYSEESDMESVVFVDPPARGDRDEEQFDRHKRSIISERSKANSQQNIIAKRSKENCAISHLYEAEVSNGLILHLVEGDNAFCLNALMQMINAMPKLWDRLISVHDDIASPLVQAIRMIMFKLYERR